MSWPVRMVEDLDVVYDAERRGECSIGMAVRAKLGNTPFSDDHEKNRPGSDAVWIRLPNHEWFCPDKKYADNQQWTLTGDWPNVTVTPSINCIGSYHGWITNGQVTEDCEGRKYDSSGKLIK